MWLGSYVMEMTIVRKPRCWDRIALLVWISGTWSASSEVDLCSEIRFPQGQSQVQVALEDQSWLWLPEWPVHWGNDLQHSQVRRKLHHLRLLSVATGREVVTSVFWSKVRSQVASGLYHLITSHLGRNYCVFSSFSWEFDTFHSCFEFFSEICWTMQRRR